jgi:O-antigen ligase
LMSLSLILFLIFFSLIVNNDKYFKITYNGFINDLNITKLFKDKKVNGESVAKNEKDIGEKKPDKMSLLRNSSHNRIFWTAILIWKEWPLTGLGFKSYRLKCVELLAKDVINKNSKHQKITCSNHAHNYYLEILTESGILGLSCFLILFIILIKKSLIFLKKTLNNNNQSDFFVIALIIILFLEIWPIQSTGSFFTSWGATFFWLNIGLLIPNVNRKSFY